MTRGKARYLHLLLTVLMVASISLMPCLSGGCRKTTDEGLPDGSFKFAHHPEMPGNDNDGIQWLERKRPYGNYSYSEQRWGYVRDWSEPLVFDVELPPNPVLAFEWVLPPEAAGDKFKLTVKVSRGDIDKTVAELKTVDKEAGYSLTWQPEALALEDYIAGKATITFDVEGLSGKSAGNLFQLANPRIFSAGRTKYRRVMLIGVDTLRADHLSCYGYNRKTTPVIDEMADRGTRYSYCVSTSPWTYPSFSAMLTGRYPSICGSTTNVRFLPEDETTLTEILSREGFSTLMVTNHVWAGPPVNIHQGFDTAIRYPLERAGVAFNKARDWLISHGDEDTFVFLQFMDPHVPYRPVKPYNTMFDPGYKGRYGKEFNDIEDVRDGTIQLTEDEIVHMEALYDGEIAYFDEQLGMFLDLLEYENMLDDTLIVFTSDHGEEFFEHGGFEHGHSLYDEMLWVPLIVSGPDIRQGETDDRVASTLDIFPTILDYYDIRVPGNISGSTLLEPLEDENRLLIAEQLRYGEELKGVTTPEYRYIYHTVTGEEELFDLRDDRQMLASVADDRRAAARSFRAFVTSYAISAGSPWFVNFQRAGPVIETAKYEGRITCPGGFAAVEKRRIDENDVVDIIGESIEFKIDVEQASEKEISFIANDDTADVTFEIWRDGYPLNTGDIFIGPTLNRMAESVFVLNIDNKWFTLGQPILRRENHDGVFIWANPARFREQLQPELTDEMKEQLQAIGYLNR